MRSQKRIQLICYSKSGQHVSLDTVAEFEKAAETSEGDPIERVEVSSLSAGLGELFSKLVIRRNIPFFSGILPKTRIPRLSILMGTEFHKPVVAFLRNRANSVYFFDAWPSNHAAIQRFIEVLKIRTVFFSSAQAASVFHKKKLSCAIHWIPEGVNITDYSFLPYPQKDIDVLAFGRKYDLLHDKIAEGLNSAGITYLYEKKKGEIVFPDRTSFIAGLARTKISICIPSDVTHPQRSGGISTMTVRYLQSMASKTLILGIMPEEMKTLFDYDPLITIDMTDPLLQIKNILADYSSYIPLIERNYRFIQEHHSWKKRWQDMLCILDAQPFTFR